jgi:hypothetical protein
MDIGPTRVFDHHIQDPESGQGFEFWQDVIV